MDDDNKEVILISSDDPNCMPCVEVENALRDKLKSGKLKRLSLNSEEATLLLEPLLDSVEKLDIPVAVVKSKTGDQICQIFQDKEYTLVACGNEIIPLREPPEEAKQPPPPPRRPK